MDFCYLPETTAVRSLVLQKQSYLNPTSLDLPLPLMVDLGGWKLLPSMEMELVPNTTVTVQLSIMNPVCSVSPSCSPLVLTLLVNIKSERPSVM
jgi:hypothetical protein